MFPISTKIGENVAVYFSVIIKKKIRIKHMNSYNVVQHAIVL